MCQMSRGEPKDEYTTAFMPSITEFLLYKYEIPNGRDHHISVSL